MRVFKWGGVFKSGHLYGVHQLTNKHPARWPRLSPGWVPWRHLNTMRIDKFGAYEGAIASSQAADSEGWTKLTSHDFIPLHNADK